MHATITNITTPKAQRFTSVEALSEAALGLVENADGELVQAADPIEGTVTIKIEALDLQGFAAVRELVEVLGGKVTIAEAA